MLWNAQIPRWGPHSVAICNFMACLGMGGVLGRGISQNPSVLGTVQMGLFWGPWGFASFSGLCVVH